MSQDRPQLIPATDEAAEAANTIKPFYNEVIVHLNAITDKVPEALKLTSSS
jgi:hypothetical protein